MVTKQEAEERAQARTMAALEARDRAKAELDAAKLSGASWGECKALEAAHLASIAHAAAERAAARAELEAAG